MMPVDPAIAPAFCAALGKAGGGYGMVRPEGRASAKWEPVSRINELAASSHRLVRDARRGRAPHHQGLEVLIPG
jgi:hypothetical protein